MLSNFQITCLLLSLVGAGVWWVWSSLNRSELEQQIEQTLEVLNSAAAYWQFKLAEPSLRAYAENYLRFLEAERGDLLAMQTALAIGGRLTVKQLIRLDKLVAEHIAGSSAIASAVQVADPGR